MPQGTTTTTTPTQMTRQQFAAYLKSRYPQLANANDDQLVDGVLQRRPELSRFLKSAGGVTGEWKEESPFSKEAIEQEKNPALRSLRYLAGEGESLDKFAIGIVPGAAKLLSDFGPAISGNLEAQYRAGQDVIEAGKAAARLVTAPFRADTYADPHKFADEILDLASLYPLGGPAEVAAEGAEDVARSGLRSYTGTGPDFIKELIEKRAKQVAENDSAYSEKLADARKAYDERSAEAARKRAELVQKVGKKYLQEKSESQAAQTAQSRVMATRKYLSDTKSALVEKVKQNVQQTHDAVRRSLNQRWNALREKVGPADVDLQPIKESIKEAQDSILRGSPEKIAIFNNILHESPGIEDASVFQGAGASARGTPRGVPVDLFLRTIPEEKRASFLAGLSPEERQLGGIAEKPGEGNLSWNDARGYYTELGDKMFGGRGIPGDVYHALRHVRNAIDDQLKKVADSAGAGEEYASVKKDWSEYENDFRNNKSLSVGGSPLLRVLKASDPKYVEDAALGPASSRALATLLKYRKFGADPESVVALRKVDSRLSKLPKIGKEISLPNRPELPPKSAPREFVAPEKKEVPEINAKDERLKEIARVARPLGRPSTFELMSLGDALGEMLRGGSPLPGLAYPAVKRLLDVILKNKKIAEFVARDGTP